MTAGGNFIELLNLANVLFYLVLMEEWASRLGRPRVGRNAVEITVSEQALGERAKANRSLTFLLQHRQQVVLDMAVEHVVTGLVDDKWGVEVLENLGDGGRLRAIVVGNANVKRLPLPNQLVEGFSGFFNWCFLIRPVGIEDIHVVELEPLQALVGTGDDALTGTPITVRTVPHFIAGLAGNNHFVPVGLHVGCHDAAKVFFGTPRNRVVIIGQVVVGNSQVKGLVDNRLLVFVGIDAAKIVLEAEPNGGEL